MGAWDSAAPSHCQTAPQYQAAKKTNGEIKLKSITKYLVVASTLYREHNATYKVLLMWEHMKSYKAFLRNKTRLGSSYEFQTSFALCRNRVLLKNSLNTPPPTKKKLKGHIFKTLQCVSRTCKSTKACIFARIQEIHGSCLRTISILIVCIMSPIFISKGTWYETNKTKTWLSLFKHKHANHEIRRQTRYKRYPCFRNHSKDLNSL